ncbi:hypothetical protein VI03_06500 [Burkholderia vietnamiensis]|nr:hypothetical protein VI03_06500 [Burkholderia vietnamiensis]
MLRCKQKSHESCGRGAPMRADEPLAAARRSASKRAPAGVAPLFARIGATPRRDALKGCAA